MSISEIYVQNPARNLIFESANPWPCRNGCRPIVKVRMMVISYNTVDPCCFGQLECDVSEQAVYAPPEAAGKYLVQGAKIFSDVMPKSAEPLLTSFTSAARALDFT